MSEPLICISYVWGGGGGGGGGGDDNDASWYCPLRKGEKGDKGQHIFSPFLSLNREKK